MASKRKSNSHNPAKGKWSPFVAVDPEEVTPEKAARIRAICDDKDWEMWQQDREDFRTGKNQMWQNSHYTVVAKTQDDGMTWLSIRHNDRSHIHDWRHLQRIKNELCGPEREAIELYPAESRLVDEANQFHLWVLPEDMRVPVGFDKRMVDYTGEDAASIGAVQRPIDEGE